MTVETAPLFVLQGLTLFFLVQALFPRVFLRFTRWHMALNNRFQARFGMRTVVEDEEKFLKAMRWTAWAAAASLALVTVFAQRSMRAAKGGAPGEPQRLAAQALDELAPAGGRWLESADGSRGGPRRLRGDDGVEYISSFVLRRCTDGSLEASSLVTGPRGERGWAARSKR